MELHRYTKRFIRFLKEEHLYSTFLDLIKEKKRTKFPLKTLDLVVRKEEKNIVEERCVSSLLDVCFKWDDKLLTFEEMDNLFCKAVKVDKNFNYS